LKQLQLIQVLSINAEMSAEPPFPRANGLRVNRRKAVPTHEKGGVRFAEAAFRAGNEGVLPGRRFTAR
jgi:hypothetical protein